MRSGGAAHIRKPVEWPGLTEHRQRVGVLVVRAWLEPGNGNPLLKARITARLDVNEQAERVSAGSNVDEICERVRELLEEFVHSEA
jgi:hypothetical protein